MDLAVSSGARFCDEMDFGALCQGIVWNAWPPKSSHAASVRGSSDTASESPARNAPPSAIGCTGAAPSPGSGIRTRGSSSSAWRRRPMEGIAPGAHSRGTGAGNSCIGLCTAPGLRINPPPFRRTMDWSFAIVTSPRRCGAPHPRTSRRESSSPDASRTSSARCGCCGSSAWSSSSGRSRCRRSCARGVRPATRSSHPRRSSATRGDGDCRRLR